MVTQIAAVDQTAVLAPNVPADRSVAAGPIEPVDQNAAVDLVAPVDLIAPVVMNAAAQIARAAENAGVVHSAAAELADLRVRVDLLVPVGLASIRNQNLKAAAMLAAELADCDLPAGAACLGGASVAPREGAALVVANQDWDRGVRDSYSDPDLVAGFRADEEAAPTDRPVGRRDQLFDRDRCYDRLVGPSGAAAGPRHQWIFLHSSARHCLLAEPQLGSDRVH